METFCWWTDSPRCTNQESWRTRYALTHVHCTAIRTTDRICAHRVHHGIIREAWLLWMTCDVMQWSTVQSQQCDKLSDSICWESWLNSTWQIRKHACWANWSSDNHAFTLLLLVMRGTVIENNIYFSNLLTLVEDHPVVLSPPSHLRSFPNHLLNYALHYVPLW